MDDISLCPACSCITHTIDGCCGKCKAPKLDDDTGAVNKSFTSAKSDVTREFTSMEETKPNPGSDEAIRLGYWADVDVQKPDGSWTNVEALLIAEAQRARVDELTSFYKQTVRVVDLKRYMYHMNPQQLMRAYYARLAALQSQDGK